MGVELEQDAINDTAELLSKTGWIPGKHVDGNYRITGSGMPQRDNLFTYLRVIRHAPGAVLWEKKWTKGVPSKNADATKYLEQHTGYSFPVLRPIKQGRVVRTLTASLRDNLDKEITVTGLKIKMYAGYIFSALTWNNVLTSEIENLSAQLAPELTKEKFDLLDEISQMYIPTDSDACEKVIVSFQQQLSLSEKDAAVILLAVAASHSPAQVNDAIIETIMKYMEPAGIVEIVVWLSVLQLLNRMSSYYALTGSYEG
jgi:alkylhydroperoxidase family enzyme